LSRHPHQGMGAWGSSHRLQTHCTRNAGRKTLNAQKTNASQKDQTRGMNAQNLLEGEEQSLRGGRSGRLQKKGVIVLPGEDQRRRKKRPGLSCAQCLESSLPSQRSRAPGLQVVSHRNTKESARVQGPSIIIKGQQPLKKNRANGEKGYM